MVSEQSNQTSPMSILKEFQTAFKLKWLKRGELIVLQFHRKSQQEIILVKNSEMTEYFTKKNKKQQLIVLIPHT